MPFTKGPSFRKISTPDPNAGTALEGQVKTTNIQYICKSIYNHFFLTSKKVAFYNFFCCQFFLHGTVKVQFEIIVSMSIFLLEIRTGTRSQAKDARFIKILGQTPLFKL